MSNRTGELDQWEAKQGTFVSVRSAYRNLTGADQNIIAQQNSSVGYSGFLALTGESDNRQAERTIWDDALATVVNKNGLVRVGGKYRLYRFDGTVEFSNLNIMKEVNLLIIKASDPQRGIVYKPLLTTVSSARVADDSRTELDNYGNWPRRRVVGQIVAIGGTDQYDQLGGVTKHQQRILGVWFDENADNIRLEYTYTVGVGSGGGTAVSGDYGYTIPQSGFYQFLQPVIVNEVQQKFRIISFVGKHSARCKDGVYRTVVANW